MNPLFLLGKAVSIGNFLASDAEISYGV